MRNSKGKLHIAVRALVFFLVVLALIQVCNFLIADEIPHALTARIMMHEMYTSTQDIDLVFAGSSTAYLSFDPEIWDETLGMHTFNLGSSAQRPDSTYYLLKEFFSIQHPKYCILNMGAPTLSDLDRFHNPAGYYLLTDYFRPSLNKLQFMLQSYDGESIYVGLLPFLRYKTSMSLDLFLDNIREKTNPEYKNYAVGGVIGDEIYKGRGFAVSIYQTEPGHVGNLLYYPFSIDNLEQKIVDYIPKIAQLCRENDCELIMIVSPLPYAHMAMQEDYQSEVDLNRQLAQECGAPLFDYSLCRPEYLPLDDSDFYDYIHTSGKGAAVFSAAASQLVADYIAGNKIDYDALFYGSYQELMDASPYVFNAWITRDGDVYTGRCTYGAGVVPEYQFSWRDGPEGAWQILRDYGPSHELDAALIPPEAAELRLCVRPEGCPDEYQQWESLSLP